MALAFYPGTGPFQKFLFVFLHRGALFCALSWLFVSTSPPARAEDTVGAGSADGSVDFAAGAVAVLADTLIVRGGRNLDPIAPATGSLTTRVQLDETSGARDVADLLDSVAGLQVRRYGGVGASAVPSIRGSAAAQVRMFIDGMPLDDAQIGAVDLANIPLERFQTVDIHRGLVPVGLGGIGGSGAVDFHTRRGDRGLDLTCFGGSFGDRGARASWGGSNGDGSRSGLVMVHGRRSDNDFEFSDPLGTYNRSDDDTLAIRRNAWIREHGAWLTGALAGRFGRVRSSLGFFRKDGGRPGLLGQESPHASVRYDRLDGRLEFGFLDDLLVLDLAAGRNREYLYDPLFETGGYWHSVTHSRSRDLDGRLVFSPVLWSGPAGGWFTGLSLQSGLERRSQWFELWYDGEPDPQRQRTVTTAFAQLDGNFFADRLLVAPAWRWSRHRDNIPPESEPSFYPWLEPEEENVSHVRDADSPSLGMVWKIRPERIFLEAHASLTERAPTWVELFGHRGGIAGNPDLLPEEITSVDLALGLRSADGNFTGRAALFRSDTDQTIIYIQNSPGTSKAQNFGAARTTGLELETMIRLPLRVKLRGNLTLQEARDRSGVADYEGKALPYLPDRQVWLQLVRPVGRWRPRLELIAVSGNFRDRYNTELNSPEARVTGNLALARDWPDRWLGPGGRLTTELELMNVTDNRTYDLEGFPLPGRSVHLAVRVRR